MSNLKTARGIILRKSKYGEADLIVQLILSNGEKISALARSAMRSKRRFGGGVLDPTQFVEIVYRFKGEHRLNTLEEAHVIDGFDGLRKDYDRMDLALYMVSAVAKVSQEGDSSSPALFNLLGHALKRLQSFKNLLLFRAAFQLKLLYQQGVLEQEAWMAPVFKTNFRDWDEDLVQVLVTPAQAQWLEGKTQSYLQSAATHVQD